MSPVTPGVLTLCCSDMAAPPLFWTEADGTRHGYEPDAAAAVAEASGLELRWIFRQWADFARALADGECDGIWCGSAITAERERRFLYTRPYAVFDESVVVRAGDAVGAPSDLRGRRVGAIAASTNMALAETFDGRRVRAVRRRHRRRLRRHAARAADRGGRRRGRRRRGVHGHRAHASRISASHSPCATRNRWGCALRLGDDELKHVLDDAIAQADLPAVWRHWLPSLACPL